MMHDWWMAHRFELVVDLVIAAAVFLFYAVVIYKEKKARKP